MAKVKGNIVCTRKSEKLVGHKLLILQPVGRGGKAQGSPFLGIDAVQAGVGDLVLVARHGSAVKVILNDNVPANAIVVGHIDQIYYGDETTPAPLPQSGKAGRGKKSR
ncbi:MAG TPA: EutN/CcmL family microcompartment protein [bacterium]|nr:EutN/CcmL family microcompartment protein [bacterium]